MTNAEAIKLIKAERRLLQSEGDPKEFPSALELAEALGKVIKALEAQEWVPVSERLPEVDEDGYSDKILLSFANFILPAIGEYREDNGGAFYAGDDDKPLNGYGLLVNAWKPLPEPYREDE